VSKQKRLSPALRSLRGTMRTFWPFVRPERPLLVGAGFALLAEIALRLAEPWPLKYVFDQVVPTGRHAGHAAAQAPWGLSAGGLLALCAAAVVVLSVLRALAAYANTVGLALVGNRVLSAVRSALFDHLQRLPLAYHTRARTGDLLARVVGDVGRLQDVVATAVLPLIVHALTLVGMLVLMFLMHWELGLLAAAIFPLFLLSSVRLGRRIREAARLQRQREGQMGSTAAEALSAIRVVQALGLEEQQSRAFARQNTASLREGAKAARLAASLERGVDCLIGLVTALVLWRGASLVLRGQLTPGDLVVFLAYLKNAFKPMRDMAKYTGRIAKAAASGERIVEVLHLQPSIADPPGAAPAPDAIEEVRFEGVGLDYEPGTAALQGFDLTVRRGEKVALVGPSGGGKTTVATLLLRLYDPSRGRILFNGQDIRGFTLDSVRRRTGAVLQESTLFGVSVRQNIACGNPSAGEEQIAEACRLANAWDFVARLPRGLDTVVGERGDTLSGGQRRRIAIARAAVRAAPILLLDEPTAGLDNDNRRLVSEALARLGEGRITITIAHDLSTTLDADRILYLEHGAVVESGTHDELMTLSGRYAAMFRLQAAGQRERAGHEEAADALPR
jgi:ATP-binding cassette, subfamily B, bacterial